MPIPLEWNLTGKTALITADLRGWTPILASALAEAGANVAIAGSARSDMADAVKAVESQGQRAVALSTDVTNTTEVEAAVASTVGEFDRLDILVNNTRVEFGNGVSCFLGIRLHERRDHRDRRWRPRGRIRAHRVCA